MKQHIGVITFIIVFVIFFGFFWPMITKDNAEREEIPKLDKQFVGVYYGGIARDMTEELKLSDEDSEKLMDYINYGGRDWTKTETGEHIEELFSMYVVQVNPSQFFYIPAAAGQDGSLDMLFITTPAEDEADKKEDVYSTLVKANAAAPLLSLLEKYKP